jgi:hypothetical protein
MTMYVPKGRAPTTAGSVPVRRSGAVPCGGVVQSRQSIVNMNADGLPSDFGG